ncbi:MAG: TusE/DsrC/DsvC family sulfur relay protein [Phyllobacteriaceae bacterium]|nr:TusE/DsrC/DsvC family sulfur relay protein [Phyllobacteriaceae bacterium]
MAITFEGREIETTASGYLVDQEDWSEDLARVMAAADGIELGQEHMDLIAYLREEFFDNGGNLPNTRNIIKAMSERWGRELAQRDLYELFPLDPSKQGGRIAGLPESRRKGGY